MTDAPLGQRKISRFFFPLALSWIFMAIEAPISIGVISRMPDPVANTAAFLLMMGLALWIESPVIDLLSTSTTLTKNHSAFRSMARFAWSLMGWVTFAHFAVVFTPIYGLLVNEIMGVPVEVSQAARTGLMIMLPWSALIGWRRTLQGILIRNGQTRLIGFGTGLRVTTMAVSAVSLYHASPLRSIDIVAWSLILSVASEAVFIHILSRLVLREMRLDVPSPDPEEDLGTRTLLAFHLPLTATTMVAMLTTPIITAGLSRTPDAARAMAAFQVAYSVLFLFRTTTFALPEVVITLSSEREGPAALRRFCTTLGLLLSALLFFFSISPLDDWLFREVLGAEPDIVRSASFVLAISSLIPLVNALQGYVRGMLTVNRLTMSRMVATTVAVTILALMLMVGISARWPGLVTASVAITTSLLAELAVLTWAWQRGKARQVILTAGG